ncbi:hypothetical protein [Candidatus Similichlamydia epinepheli]|uniref:hypothetical protein n=1 Tax=Candidatus Similichlamydia epinepheli TaxID=1903953 RepID=UPI0013008733|nr:hypothetical protein [Candidatus Similichlamydia epinepheli]
MLGSIASACSWLSGSIRVRGFISNNARYFRCFSSLCDMSGGVISAVAFKALGVGGTSLLSCIKISATVEAIVRSSRAFIDCDGPLDALLAVPETIAFLVTISLLFMISQVIPGWLGFIIGLYALVRVIVRLLEHLVPDLMRSPFINNVKDAHLQSRGDFVSIVSNVVLGCAVWSVLRPVSFAHYTKPFQALLELHFFLKEIKLL